MKFRYGLLPFLLCLLVAPVALSQSKPVLQFKGELAFGDPPEKIIAHRFLVRENKLVLIGQRDVRILDAATGSFVESRTIDIPDFAEDCPRVISPDGRRLLVSGNYGAKKDKVKRPASIWDLQTGNQIAVLDKTSRPVCAAFWTDNGKTLATSSSGSAPYHVYDSPVEISFWDGQTFKFLNSLPSDKVNWWYLTDAGDKCFYSTGPVKSVLFFFKYLSDQEGPIKLWDVESGTAEKTISSSDSNVERKIRGILVSPGEKFLAFVAQRPKSKDTERRLVIWELDRSSDSKYQLEEKYEINPSPKIDGAKFSPDGKYFALDAGKNLQIYDSKTGEKQSELLGVRSAPSYWLNDNRILLFDHDTRMEALETATGKPLYRQDLVYDEYQYTDGDTTYAVVADYTRIVVQPNRELFLTYSNQYVKVYNSLTGELLQTLVAPPMDYTKKKPRLSDKTLVSKAGWSRDGKTLYVISEDQKSVSLWLLIEG